MKKETIKHVALIAVVALGVVLVFEYAIKPKIAQMGTTAPASATGA